MKLGPERLASALADDFAVRHLVCGDEPLLAEEAADAIRAAARARGFGERRVFFIERGFDWQALRLETDSLSLFSERRLFELRMPSGKPDRGADALTALLERPPPDTAILVITGKLDRKAMEAPWVRAIDRDGIVVNCAPIAPAALPGWLVTRARRAGLTLEPEAAELIAARVEGNLLAAAQEVAKLALLSESGRIDVARVSGAVADSARFDVFALGEAAAAGDATRALHVLAALRAEGVEPTLIMWALAREVRGLWQARERERLRSAERGSGWNLANPPKPQALERSRKLPLARLLREAAYVDRVIKGAARGEAWSALETLTAGLCGALPQAMLTTENLR